MIYRLTLTAALLAAPAFAEQEYGTSKEMPPAYGQGWGDAGTPWKAAGRQFKEIGRSIGQDARAIGPATKENFTTGRPRWNWKPGTPAPEGGYIETQPAQSVYSEPAYQPQYYETTPSYQPAPYIETVPTYETAPTYEPYTGPVYGN